MTLGREKDPHPPVSRLHLYHSPPLKENGGGVLVYNTVNLQLC